MDKGSDLVLEKGALYEIRDTLKVRHDSQKIYTDGAKTLSEYARLKIASPKISRMLNMNGKARLSLEHIIFDGNRYSERDIESRDSLVQAGMSGGDGQSVKKLRLPKRPGLVAAACL